MKKVIVLLIVSVLTMSASFGMRNPELVKEIEKKVVIDLSKIELDKYSQDYVMVSFRIVNNKIKIQEINGTSKALKQAIIRELYEIDVDCDYNDRQTYQYRFTFEKI